MEKKKQIRERGRGVDPRRGKGLKPQGDTTVQGTVWKNEEGTRRKGRVLPQKGGIAE